MYVEIETISKSICSILIDNQNPSNDLKLQLCALISLHCNLDLIDINVNNIVCWVKYFKYFVDGNGNQNILSHEN